MLVNPRAGGIFCRSSAKARFRWRSSASVSLPLQKVAKKQTGFISAPPWLHGYLQRREKIQTEDDANHFLSLAGCCLIRNLPARINNLRKGQWLYDLWRRFPGKAKDSRPGRCRALLLPRALRSNPPHVPIATTHESALEGGVVSPADQGKPGDIFAENGEELMSDWRLDHIRKNFCEWPHRANQMNRRKALLK